ncbi:PhnE/PtxC family ABC transporter permease [Nocardioides marmotae]|uniref:PhnE/PtxC family ABC transporter permease n=1 Tax=Nocardioides marmotae TaxID=2663857 RepID=UPI0012B595F3|nr:ABC transporter permease subunit [Nocardioides marmotae]MBC9733646.1 ABC transporter permease subunit [Nocardioides marmotae]MTB84749.1 ABC transporter permease subunit [Nocardioides marmotae]
MSQLSSIASLEATGPAELRPARRRRWPGTGRTWLAVWCVLLGWSLWSFLAEAPRVVNAAGLPAFGEFWAAALRPDLSAATLRTTLDAAATTMAFALLGTLLSVVLGVVLAPLLSQTLWSPASGSRVARVLRVAGLLLARATVALPRGVHEAVWALLLLSVLGRDPLVGVLAIAVPFGAITAKVFAELIDEADRAPYDALREAGAGRAAALAYGLLPTLLPRATSYAFYRLECSVRSAVVLGMIGAGGLGLQLSLAFQGSQHERMWTSIYALVLLGAGIDRWGAHLRRGGSRRRWAVSGVVLLAGVVASVRHLDPDLGRWFSEHTADLLARLVDDLVPPALPAGGWSELLAAAVETVQMSVVAITIATLAGVLVALVAARGATSAPRRVAAWVARQLLLVTRAVPPPVWALLVLFVMLPGPLPGAVALGVYTFGILGRLFAEVLEELDPGPRDALTGLGATPVAAFAYASLPAAAGQLIAYSLYRWEVTARETVIVGIVGAGGLGRLLEQQRAAFDFPAMTTTVLALVAVCLVVDLVSLAVRSSTR